MSSNITFVKKKGGGVANFTLFGTHDLGVAGGNGQAVWTEIEMGSPDPWEKVTISGFDNMLPKFHGATQNHITISGYIMSATDLLSDMITHAILLLSKNKVLISWTPSLAGIDLSGGSGLVLLSIIAKPLGEGTGPRWPFSMTGRVIGPGAVT